MSFGIGSTETSVVFGGATRDHRLVFTYEHSNDRLTTDVYVNGVWKGRKVVAWWASSPLSSYTDLNNQLRVVKQDNVVVVSAVWITGTLNPGTYEIATIAAGWRPSNLLSYVSAGVFTSLGVCAGRVIIHTNGKVTLRTNQTISDGYEFTVTYFTD